MDKTQQPKKKRGLSDTKSVALALSGVSSLGFAQRLIRQSLRTILHGDRNNAERTADMASDERVALSRRLKLEGLLFLVVIGWLFPVLVVFQSATLAGSIPFWLILISGVLLVGNFLGLMKFWQSLCVRTGHPVSFRAFIRHFFRGEAPTHGG